MLTSKRFMLVLGLLLLIGMAAFFLGRTHRLEEELAAKQRLAEEQAVRLVSYERVGVGDSLVREGNYREAIARYTDLQSDTTLTITEAELASRIDHAERLVEVGGALDTLRRMRARRLRPEAPSLAPLQPQTVSRMALEASDPDQYDSLRFALQKADMQIRNLESRLRNTSGGNYLTFDSRQGNEVYYVGDIKNGRANGRGVALLSSGSRYLGEWQNNMKHGIGEFHWPDGASYEGEYEDDLRSGQGTYRFPDGSVFVGQWEDDLRNGQGIFYDSKGEVVARGEWEGDELVEG